MRLFIETSNQLDNLKLCVSFMQMFIAAGTSLSSVNDASAVKEKNEVADLKLDQKLKEFQIPLFKLLTKYSQFMLKKDLRDSLQQIEDLASILVILTINEEGENDNPLAVVPEASQFVMLVLALAEIPNLLSTTPAIQALFSMLVKSGSLLVKVSQIIKSESMANKLVKMCAHCVD